MSESSIVVEKRTEKGKAHVRRLRRSGRLPGVIYGEVENPQPILMDEHQFEMFLKKGHSLITLKVNGSEQRAVVREIQRHPVSGKILHVDFMVVRKGHKINMVKNFSQPHLNNFSHKTPCCYPSCSRINFF